ncbi:metal-dependent hydrolase [Chitinimonas koreensis]|uniref:metal-dependent hydrolase n=2 Tax=Chitinimonas koreensis TaxID=356302 RepID=UPI000416DD33|nr:metal-dependent hydrolase [Chitinimonas koreensis]
MFVAHLPSGYLLSTQLLNRLRNPAVPTGIIVAAGMLGAVAPDFDLLYFYLVDQRQTHHHQYFSHWPLCWIALTLIAAAALRWSRHALPLLAFDLGGLLHMALDTLVGDIWWFAPLLDRPFALFSVPALYQPWWLNFILHWSFAVELAICAWAWWVYHARSRPTP